MSNRSKPRVSRILTIVISFLSLIIGFASAYYAYQSRVDTKIERLNEKIRVFQEREKELRSIPNLRVTSISLDEIDLPLFAFEGLNKYPIGIKIEHIYGGSATDISLLVQTTASIISSEVIKDSEPHVVEKSSDRSITVSLEKMRPTSVFQMLIFTKEPSSITYNLIADSGKEFIADNSSSNTLFPGLNNWWALEPSSIEDSNEARVIIQGLSFLQSMEIGKPIINFQLASFIALCCLYFSFIIYVLIKTGRRYAEHYKMHKAIDKCIEEKSLRVGMSVSEIMDILGEPRIVSKPKIGKGENAERWDYVPVPFLVMKQSWPDIFLIIDDNKLMDFHIHAY